MVAAEQPERVEDPAEDAGHRGLAGAGGAGEDEVALGRLDGQALPGAQAGHVQLRGQRLDLPLDRLQAHHALQLGERLFEQGGVGGPGGQAAAAGPPPSPGRRRSSGCRPPDGGSGGESLSVPSLGAEQRVDPVGALQDVLPRRRRGRSPRGRPPRRRSPSPSEIAASRAEVSMKAGSTRCTARYRGRAAADAAGALVGAGQPVAQLLALRLLAAAAHQRGGQQRLRLAVHLQPDPGHARRRGRPLCRAGRRRSADRCAGRVAPSP